MGLLKTTRFADRPMRVSIHKALNSSRGVIRCRELSGMTEMEIRTELQEQGVVEVHTVTVKKDTENGPPQHPVSDLQQSRPPERDHGRLSKSEGGLVCSQPYACFNCNKFGHTSQRCKVAAKCTGCGKDKHEGQCERPSCALIEMVPTLHWLKIAQSGRRRRFNVSALRNAYPFRKPDSWLKPRCRL